MTRIFLHFGWNSWNYSCILDKTVLYTGTLNVSFRDDQTLSSAFGLSQKKCTWSADIESSSSFCSSGSVTFEDWNIGACCVYQLVRLFLCLQYFNLQTNLCNFRMNVLHIILYKELSLFLLLPTDWATAAHYKEHFKYYLPKKVHNTDTVAHSSMIDLFSLILIDE